MLRRIKGQDRAISILNRAIHSHKISQAYLFYGPKGVGKFTTALYFAMAINCHTTDEEKPCGICSSCRKFLKFNHPDFLYLFPTPLLKITNEGEIKNSKVQEEYNQYIEQKSLFPWKNFTFSSNIEIHREKILHLQHRINLSLSEANKKVYIIEDADKMNNSAANTFLKTLEEPPDDVILILTTTKINALLPTILSRCQKLQFTQLPKNIIEELIFEKYNLDTLQAKLFARISNGDVEKAFELAESGELTIRKEALDFLDICLAKDDLKFMNFLEKYKSTKNTHQLIDIFSNLIIWFADLVLFLHQPEEIANLDQSALFEHVYRINPNVNDNINDLVKFIEERKANLLGHVQVQLVITSVYFEIRKAIYLR